MAGDLGDETRGGHIPGAVAFPSAWATSVDRPEIERLLDEKGIAPDRPIVVYGQDAVDASTVVATLKSFGVDDVTTLAGGFAAWAADPARPVEKLPRHEQLVPTRRGCGRCWPANRSKPHRPADHVLFHVNFGVPEEYAEGHIPGALYLDTNWLEDPADWNRRSPEALERAVRELGITKDTTVIVYGRDTEGDANEKWPGRRAGQIAATRALMILRYAGVDDLRLLDGGYDWWVRDGNPVETIERRAHAGRRLRGRDPAPAGGHRGPAGGEGRSWPTRTAPRSSASGRGVSTSAR